MSKKSVLNSMRVAEPCSEGWDDMTGNDRVRFCSHCAKNVNDISRLTPKEAVRLVRGSGGNICIRYQVDPVTRAPIFTDRLHQIARRSPAMATGVLAASITFSTAAYAQGEIKSVDMSPTIAVRQLIEAPNESPKENEIAKRPTQEKKGSLSGRVLDPSRTIVTGVPVSLLDQNGNEIAQTVSRSDGAFNFDGLQEGTYAARTAYFEGFSSTTVNGIAVAGDDPSSTDIVLDVGMTMGGVMIAPMREYKGTLSAAVAAEDIDGVKELISQGAKVNAREEDRTTPLFIAVENGNIQILETLLNFGAKVNARDSQKRTPLMNLDEDASPELIDLMVRHGVKINLVANDGSTALMLAARDVSPSMLQALIDAGADINLTDNAGQSALMNAAERGNLENVRVLLMAGAMVNLRNKDGLSAWDQATDSEIVELLATHGAEVKKEEDESDDQSDTTPAEVPDNT